MRRSTWNSLATTGRILIFWYLSTFRKSAEKIEVWLKSDKCRGFDKSLPRPTSLCILFDGENIPFDTSLVINKYIYINSTNIPPIMIKNRIYEN